VQWEYGGDNRLSGHIEAGYSPGLPTCARAPMNPKGLGRRIRFSCGQMQIRMLLYRRIVMNREVGQAQRPLDSDLPLSLSMVERPGSLRRSP